MVDEIKYPTAWNTYYSSIVKLSKHNCVHHHTRIALGRLSVSYLEKTDSETKVNDDRPRYT